MREGQFGRQHPHHSAAPSPALPLNVLLQLTVLFSKMMDKNKFLVLLRNESLKPTSIPMGTVIAHLHVADVATELPSPMSETPRRLMCHCLILGTPTFQEWKE